MIIKDKVFIISSNVDDSIKKSTLSSDVIIFNTFKEFESYVDSTPIQTSMIIINSKDLPFTNNSMVRLLNMLDSTFVSLSGYVYYMVDDIEIKDKVDTLCKTNDRYLKLKCIYSSTLYAKDVADILSGEALSTKSTVTVVKTYRVRASDYIRSQKDKEGINYADSYVSDEDELSGIEDEKIPVDSVYTKESKAKRHIVCCNSIKERTAWVILKAQYMSMSGKTLILEKDIDYHTMYDMLSKSDIEYELFEIKDLFRDCSDLITSIRSSKARLIFVGSKERINYDYDIIMNTLIYNLEDYLDYYIYETELSQIPYGAKVDIVIPSTVPDILKSGLEMSTIPKFNDVLFIGLEATSYGSVSLSESEFNSLLTDLFQENIIHSAVVKINGLVLKKEVGLGGILMYTGYNN